MDGPVVTLLVSKLVALFEILFVAAFVRRGMLVVVRLTNNLVLRGVGRTSGRPAILTCFSVHRHALTNEPCQFGKRIVSLRAGLFRTAPDRGIAIRTVLAFSHEIRPVQAFTIERQKLRNSRPVFAAFNPRAAAPIAKRGYRISFGASTPSSASPEVSTVATP